MMLYRAANDSYTNSDTTAFATDRTSAEAYLDNPGFGGAKVYAIDAEIDESTVLDTTTGDALPEWLVEVLPNSWDCLGAAIGMLGRVSSALAENGIKWVRLVDSFPAGSITMLLIGSDDTIEELLAECAQ